MNVAEIKTNDIANGEGVRTSLFVSGCRHCCPDCFNSMAWDFQYGKPFTEETEKEIAENKIDNLKVEALKKSIEKHKIGDDVVALILAGYNYAKIEDIEIKNYMNIVNDFKSKK